MEYTVVIKRHYSIDVVMKEIGFTVTKLLQEGWELNGPVSISCGEREITTAAQSLFRTEENKMTHTLAK